MTLTVDPRYIPYGRQYIDEDDINAVLGALKSDWLTQGPTVRRFEEDFAGLVGSRFAVAVNSGTAALHVACLAAGFGPGDEVVTTPITFVATANCTLYVGARPVFVDIDPSTFNLDVKDLKNYIKQAFGKTTRTGALRGDKGTCGSSEGVLSKGPCGLKEKGLPRLRGIIPVHFAGLPCDMAKIHQIAREYKLVVIEDACHALGAKYMTGGTNGSSTAVGSCAHSDMTAFSFHPVKHITTGEGGMITTNDESLYERLLLFRNHGIVRSPQSSFTPSLYPSPEGRGEVGLDKSKTHGHGNGQNPWYYEMEDLGFNYRITDIQCALGRSQLRKLETFVARRRSIACRYAELLERLPKLHGQFQPKGYYSSYHLFTLFLDTSAKISRDDLMLELKEKGIGSQVHYIPVYRHPFYRRLGYQALPKAERFFGNCLSIPIFPAMSDEDVERVLTALEEVGRKL